MCDFTLKPLLFRICNNSKNPPFWARRCTVSVEAPIYLFHIYPLPPRQQGPTCGNVFKTDTFPGEVSGTVALSLWTGDFVDSWASWKKKENKVCQISRRPWPYVASRFEGILTMVMNLDDHVHSGKDPLFATDRIAPIHSDLKSHDSNRNPKFHSIRCDVLLFFKCLGFFKSRDSIRAIRFGSLADPDSNRAHQDI